jgi:hypothetical protein
VCEQPAGDADSFVRVELVQWRGFLANNPTRIGALRRFAHRKCAEEKALFPKQVKAV